MNTTKSKVKSRRIRTARAAHRYFLCAYKGKTRMTVDASSPNTAARQCFGTVEGVAVLPIKHWEKATAAEREEMRVEVRNLINK